MATQSKIDIFIDRGGTFTDCVYSQHNRLHKFKTPSSDSSIAECLLTTSKSTGKVPLDLFNRIVVSSTLATNTLLEESGPPVALFVTKGFKNVLDIGDQRRPEIFNFNIPNKKILYSHVFEIDERITLVNSKFSNIPIQSEFESPITSGNISSIMKQLKELNIRHVALSLVHSVIQPKHELQIMSVLSSNNFEVYSSHIYPIRNYLNRTLITVLDAYLTPVVQNALDSLYSQFDDPIKAKNKIFMMTSTGVVKLAKMTTGTDALLSGPAGGMVSLQSLYSCTAKIPLIGLDIGGTSTDLSRYGGSKIERSLEYKHGDLLISLPFVDITTLSAGGGSICKFKNGLLQVGPSSVGSYPGPLMYDRNGADVSISDCNAVLGYLQPGCFPKLFGHDSNQPLNINASVKGLELLTDQINSFYSTDQSIFEVANGFLSIACHLMASKIKSITQYKGYATRDHILDSFGGAGSQLVCLLADLLDIETILIHEFSSVQSAYGISQGDIMVDNAISTDLTISSTNEIVEIVNKLKIKNERECLEVYNQSGIHSVFLNCRYIGSNTDIEVPYLDAIETFELEHTKLFGFKMDREISVVMVRVRTVIEQTKQPCQLYDDYLDHKNKLELAPETTLWHECYFDKLRRVPFYQLQDSRMKKVKGPCVLYDINSTIVVYPQYTAYVVCDGCVLVKDGRARENANSSIELSVFSNRFMAIAEEMGQVLQKTAVSVNIKERLDFSCALFNEQGDLISNAPHIPVHLGSMSICVKEAIINRHEMLPNQVYCTNDPALGGSHLPDITVVTPIFYNDRLVGFTASRAHHADVGGTTPGSMPCDSKFLEDEGHVLKSILIIKDGEFLLENLQGLLKQSRNPNDNVSDLKAQVAANNRGIQLVMELIGQSGLDKMHQYMDLIIKNAQSAVQRFLNKVEKKLGNRLHAIDYMDDGSAIELTVAINKSNAVFDFTNTATQGYHNLNAPVAIVNSAVLYCIRCLIDEPIPLNEGCLKPITLILPENCLINPNFKVKHPPACVGGNVMTSQRVVDVIFKAFEACAASQGCCNNLTFGIQSGEGHFGFYETICGGAGASEIQNGKDAVHTHMTNTKITDVEVLESRYPVVLHRFEIRENSGGKGKNTGGDGVIRNIEFCKDNVKVNILSERRSLAPYGLNGGLEGMRGKNTWIHQGIELQLGGKNTFVATKHDQIIIETRKLKINLAGGGGWGSYVE
eukprot:NODE_56_length_25944_cov_0.235287.p2 type:complete len:1211 gc:universal NODE_56_length_25944_cov_0.235287:1074-4706(+)